jgi:tRNA (guanine10-N2)-dimethyltransferase
VPKLFFLLSGESPTLPASEVKAILESEGFQYTNPSQLDQVLRLESDLASVQPVQIRSAFTRFCAQELFFSDATPQEMAKAAENTDFKSVLKSGESFVVRINRIKNYADEDINTMALESKLGAIIKEHTDGTHVDLKQADKTFIGIITDEKLIFGLKLTEIQSKTFSERRPRKKPFFHPSAMPSKLARCMVNLSHAKAESLLLDPFCGTGSSLIEASYIGCRAVGVDALRKMVFGCRKNLRFFNISPEGLILGDARKLPFFKVDCVVTDPPYGRSASTLKATTRQLVQEVLVSAHGLLGEGQRICIALPIKVNQQGDTEHMAKDLAGFIEGLGFKTLESHLVYVHRTLTREIMVYEKI